MGIRKKYDGDSEGEPNKEPDSTKDQNTDNVMSLLSAAMDKPELRVTGVYGDINEDRCSEAIMGLLSLELTSLSLKYENPEDPDSKMIETREPIEFYVSTYGGQALEMFAVYDTIRKVRQEVPIHTYGLGKVMSAGVLLLASGTKGQRRIGRFCRVMIHGVVAGQHGHIADIENEFSEVKSTQKMYIKALAEETDMTERYIKKLMDRKTNVYLDAEEAVSLGIADIIF